MKKLTVAVVLILAALLQPLQLAAGPGGQSHQHGAEYTYDTHEEIPPAPALALSQGQEETGGLQESGEETETPQETEEETPPQPQQPEEETPPQPEAPVEEPLPTEEPALEEPPQAATPQTVSEEARQAYEEYFATNKRFDWQPIGTAAAQNWGNEAGTLSVQRPGQANPVLTQAGVTNTWYTASVVYYVVEGKEIYSAPVSGRGSRRVYTTTGNIQSVVGNGELLFFLQDGAVYRMHLQSGIVDYMLQVGEVYLFRPYDNFSIFWEIDGGPVQDVDGRMLQSSSKYLYCDVREGVVKPPPEGFEEILYKNDIVVPAGAKYEVNEVTLPLEGYEEGKYFSENKEACHCHDLGYCTYTYNSSNCNCKIYDDSIQCMAFAKYVYDKIYASPEDETFGKRGKGNEGKGKIEEKDVVVNRRLTAEEWKNMPLGAYVRSYGQPGHSWVLVAKTEKNFTIYEANNDRQCGIFFRTISYAEASDKLKTIHYYYHPSINHTHKGGAYKSNGTQHWQVCTYSWCKQKINVANHKSFTYTKSSDGKTHARTCGACKYRQTGMAHSYTKKYTTKSTTQHTAACACGASTAQSHSYTYKTTGTGFHIKACSKCKYNATVSHSLSVVSKTSANHTRQCSACKQKVTANHSYGYTNNSASQHKLTCKTCKYVKYAAHSIKYTSTGSGGHTSRCTKCSYANTKKLAHTYASTYIYNSTQHWRTCTKTGCGYKLAANHSKKYAAWQPVKTAAICRSRRVTCGTCRWSSYEYDKKHSYFFGTCIKCKHKK